MTAAMLTERYERGDYLEQVPDWHAGDAAWKAQKVLRMIGKHRLAPTSVCDVGCGAGAVLRELEAALPRETRFAGYDISPQAIALCRSMASPRLSFHQRDFVRESEETFDLVLALDVVEHVGDYLGFLAALRERGRRFIFHIPLDVSAQTVARRSGYMMFMREKYGHLHYFTAPTALSTLASTGYRVLDHFYTWDVEMEAPRPLLRRLARPLRILAGGLERVAFSLRPEITAALRPYYNILVLAAPA